MQINDNMNDKRIYADYAATAPTSERAARAMYDTARLVPGNPSSAHSFGREAADVLRRSRENVAALLGCLPEEIFFTSGGTEGDNFALRAALQCGRNHGKSGTAAVSAIEHPAILRSAEAYAGQVIKIPVKRSGECDIASLEGIMRDSRNTPSTVALMYANNETGVIQPVAEAAGIAHRYGALYICDAVQGAGHVMPDVYSIGCDMLTLSGHKFSAPCGIGAIYIRKALIPELAPLIYGGGQEGGLRSGTEALPAIAALGEAAAEARETMAVEDERVRKLRDMIAGRLCELPGASIIGEGRKMPGILYIAFEGTYGEGLMLMCDTMGVAISTGSACHNVTGADTPSHVLEAMELPERLIHSAVRVSIGRYTTSEDAVKIAETLIRAVKMARE